jgi:hypothetical protein
MRVEGLLYCFPVLHKAVRIMAAYSDFSDEYRVSPHCISNYIANDSALCASPLNLLDIQEMNYYGATALCMDLADFQFINFYTDGRTPWTGD